MGMTQKSLMVGLMAALQESDLRNLNYGDRDSLGLFQQRPSQGWGTADQVTDPRYAARKFFAALRGVKGYQSMGPGQAAQAVQRSAYPSYYAKHEGDAQGLLGRLDGTDEQMPNLMPTISATPPPIDPQAPPPGLSQGGATSLGTGLDVGSPAGIESAGDMKSYSAAPPEPILPPAPAGGVVANTGATGFAPDAGTSSGVGGQIVADAKKHLGQPYQWGGLDCSGLVQMAYHAAGIDVPRVSYQQANSGTRVALNKLRPGDLVAWDNSTRNNGADHIAIYIGGGRIIEAPHTGANVRIRKFSRSEGAWGVRMGW